MIQNVVVDDDLPGVSELREVRVDEVAPERSLQASNLSIGELVDKSLSCLFRNQKMQVKGKEKITYRGTIHNDFNPRRGDFRIEFCNLVSSRLVLGKVLEPRGEVLLYVIRTTS